MAITSTILCRVCKREKYVVHSLSETTPTICSECEEREALAKRETFLVGLAQLTVEERLRKIEEHLYDRSHQKTHFPHDLIG